MSSRKRPNILITGTPGVGKTTTATLVAETLGFQHINAGEVAEQYKCYEGRDEELDTNILDEEKLLDQMEPMIDQAAEDEVGVVVDYHVCEIFPERWFDLVLVLRSSTEVLYDRLTKRGYNDKKRAQNMESEIMQVILDEAREAYDTNIVHELQSNSLQDMDSNVKRIQQWVQQWIVDNAHVASSDADDSDE